MYFQDNSDAVSNDLEGSTTPKRDLSPSDTEEEQIQPGPSRRGRGSTCGRVPGQACSRACGRGRGGGRAQNNPPPEYQWRNVKFSDYFEDDWLEIPRQRGILFDTSNYKPIDFFKSTSSLMKVLDIMTTHTNLYATQFLENRTTSTYFQYNYWTDTSLKEMQAYVALPIAMGINNKPEIPDFVFPLDSLRWPHREMRSNQRELFIARQQPGAVAPFANN